MIRRDFMKGIAGAIAAFSITKFGRADGVQGFHPWQKPRLVGSIQVFESDFGQHRIVPARYSVPKISGLVTSEEWSEVIYNIEPSSSPFMVALKREQVRQRWINVRRKQVISSFSGNAPQLKPQVGGFAKWIRMIEGKKA